MPLSQAEINAIGGESVRWPKCERGTDIYGTPLGGVWTELHGVVDRMRKLVGSAVETAEIIERNSDYSNAGKLKAMASMGADVVEKLRGDSAIARARQAVGEYVKTLDQKIGSLSRLERVPADQALASEIRAFLRSHGDKAAQVALEHAGDPTIVKAVLGAPAMLSGLTEKDRETVTARAATAMYPAEVALKGQLTAALATMERIVQSSVDRVADAAKLRQLEDGTWVSRSPLVRAA